MARAVKLLPDVQHSLQRLHALVALARAFVGVAERHQEARDQNVIVAVNRLQISNGSFIEVTVPDKVAQASVSVPQALQRDGDIHMLRAETSLELLHCVLRELAPALELTEVAQGARQVELGPRRMRVGLAEPFGLDREGSLERRKALLQNVRAVALHPAEAVRVPQVSEDESDTRIIRAAALLHHLQGFLQHRHGLFILLQVAVGVP
mmetsp:Transcript_58553/g.169896  ORF Transcript_58553/g.169896 Transcript_58553/m.169896 type:complete len:208 (+) Transcript_58553:391-1014(+)